MHMLQCMPNRGYCSYIPHPSLFVPASQHLRSRLLSHHQVDQSERIQLRLSLSRFHA